MPSMPAHDWFRPKLIALMAEAEAEGFARDVAEAVITDLVNGALSANVEVAEKDENWAQDLGEPVEFSKEMPTKEGLPPETQGSDVRSGMMPSQPGHVII